MESRPSIDKVGREGGREGSREGRKEVTKQETRGNERHGGDQLKKKKARREKTFPNFITETLLPSLKSSLQVGNENIIHYNYRCSRYQWTS